MKKLAIDALRHRYEAQKKSAEYVITNYFDNPTAIGEHPDLLAEIDKALEDWDKAQGKLEALEAHEDDSYSSMLY